MRILFLITWTDCENKYRSAQAAGHDVVTLQYDALPHDRHGELVDEVRRLAPDAIVFIGAVEKYHNRPVPTSDTLLRFREIAPFVHECNDAADPPWWPMLEEYHARGCFDVQVSIDGSHDTPLASWPEGLVLLTPIDHRPFAPRHWGERDVRLGMMGGHGNGERRQVLDALIARGLLTFHEGAAHLRPYDEMAEFLCRTRVALCHPATGSWQRMHVKGRVVEAGFAGCVLLDREGSPVTRWFEPGAEVLTYRDPDDVARLVEKLEAEDDLARAVADRFHARVVAEHHPALFWRTVLDKAIAARA